jgi:hypothetical protein
MRPRSCCDALMNRFPCVPNPIPINTVADRFGSLHTRRPRRNMYEKTAGPQDINHSWKHSFQAFASGLRLLSRPRLRGRPPRPRLGTPPDLPFPDGGGLTKAKSTSILWSSSFAPFSASTAALASLSVEYSTNA